MWVKGVPQGSILAPLLYHMNNLPNVIQNATIIFADVDTVKLCEDLFYENNPKYLNIIFFFEIQ